ncbi:hypothetical protein [Bordetella sp. N]|uniref:hypothetical protein n=1 Tax=Bordetella sp. N TaxID=1746199 RepID=UPI0012E3D007|nr:hypothetical protein [Bordetella sp. N]
MQKFLNRWRLAPASTLAPVVALLFTAGAGITAAQAATKLPDDVQAFLHQQEECEHWAGEEPYDDARAKEIAKAMADLHCDDARKQEQELRRRYPNDQAVVDALNERADQ